MRGPGFGPFWGIPSAPLDVHLTLLLELTRAPRAPQHLSSKTLAGIYLSL